MGSEFYLKIKKKKTKDEIERARLPLTPCFVLQNFLVKMQTGLFSSKRDCNQNTDMETWPLIGFPLSVPSANWRRP